MKALSPALLAAIASGQVGLAQLVHFAFNPTPTSLNTSTWDLTFDGVTYKGAYGLGQISAVSDRPGQTSGITFDINTGDSASLSLALDEANVVQRTPCTIRTALIGLDTYSIIDAPIEWVGELDTMSIGEDSTQAAVRVTAESRAVNLLHGTPSFYSDTDQRAINATDGSFQYVIDQLDKPIIWPAKAFYYQ